MALVLGTVFELGHQISFTIFPLLPEFQPVFSLFLSFPHFFRPHIRLKVPPVLQEAQLLRERGLSASQLSLARLSITPNRSSHSSSPWQNKKSAGSLKSPTPSSGKPVKKESSFSRLLRRESFSNPSKETNTQWFMDSVSRPDSLLLNTSAPIIELSEQVTPERPLRAEVERERRASRPSSSNLSRASTPCASSGSRESLSWPSSTMSTTTPTGSLDDVRPPLPAKTRDKDTDSLISNLTLNTCMPLGGGLNDYPAEPPEKPPLPDRNHNHKEA